MVGSSQLHCLRWLLDEVSQKAVLLLRRHRPDLTVTTLEVPPTGMAVVTGFGETADSAIVLKLAIMPCTVPMSPSIGATVPISDR